MMEDLQDVIARAMGVSAGLVGPDTEFRKLAT